MYADVHTNAVFHCFSGTESFPGIFGHQAIDLYAECILNSVRIPTYATLNSIYILRPAMEYEFGTLQIQRVCV